MPPACTGLEGGTAEWAKLPPTPKPPACTNLEEGTAEGAKLPATPKPSMRSSGAQPATMVVVRTGLSFPPSSEFATLPVRTMTTIGTGLGLLSFS